MFTELLPILRNRPVMLTIALVNDQAIRVNVIPKRLKEGDSGDCSLTTPLTVTGNTGGVGPRVFRATRCLYRLLCEAWIEPL